MDKDTHSVSLSLNKLPLSLRFIIKSFAFTVHHKHLRPPTIDKLNVSTPNEFINALPGWIGGWIGLLAYTASYIGLLVLLARVIWVIFIETHDYFKSEGFNLKSIIHYIRYGLKR